MLTRRSFLWTATAAAFMPALAHANPAKISAADALEQVRAGKLILIDVRTPGEWEQTGVAKGAWPLDMTQRDFGPKFLAVLERNPDHEVAIICRTGNRTGYLMEVLEKNDIKGVLDVSEGMAGGPNGKGWIPSGLPVVPGREAVDNLPADLKAL
ncbi:rhodanese-like domain-containing protein [Shimia sp. SDUM112013]|uniref:rhodanese-like domain-containing protein n=1 Tax=Shimia sp. SDUM112013 TaxID=3136160 RepID=UPI0032ED5238